MPRFTTMNQSENAANDRYRPRELYITRLQFMDLTRQPRPRVLSYSSPERTLGTRLKRKWSTVMLFPCCCCVGYGCKTFQDTNPELLERLKKVSCRFLRFYSDTSIWIISTEKWTKPVKLIESLWDILVHFRHKLWSSLSTGHIYNLLISKKRVSEWNWNCSNWNPLTTQYQSPNKLFLISRLSVIVRVNVEDPSWQWLTFRQPVR